MREALKLFLFALVLLLALLLVLFFELVGVVGAGADDDSSEDAQEADLCLFAIVPDRYGNQRRDDGAQDGEGECQLVPCGKNWSILPQMGSLMMVGKLTRLLRCSRRQSLDGTGQCHHPKERQAAGPGAERSSEGEEDDGDDDGAEEKRTLVGDGVDNWIFIELAAGG